MLVLTRLATYLRDPKRLFLTLGILVLIYLVFSFIQHYNMPLLGDLCKIIVPSEGYKAVLKHPLGLPAFLDGKTYAAPNRFLAHGSLMGYYRTVPEALQSFLDPVKSLYAATAIAKTLIQAGLMLLIASFSRPYSPFWQWPTMAILVLIAPLFQANGYNLLIGVIDKSVAYTFNYGGSILFVGLFFLPFRKGLPTTHDRSLGLTFWALMLLAVALPFMGPLNAPLIPLMIATLVIVSWQNHYFYSQETSLLKRLWKAFWHIHPQVILLFTVASLVALYSLYIGRFNIEHQTSSVALLERFSRLPEGLYKMFLTKPGPALLLGTIIVNSWLVYRYADYHFRKWYFRVLIIFGIVALVYTLLLPLGGYRHYRPLIIRRDTYTPVLLGLFWLYGLSSLQLLKTYKTKILQFTYPILIGTVTVIFLEHDKAGIKNNNCEQYAINKIKESSKDTVKLGVNCSVLSWGSFHNPARSRLKSEALQIMGVLEKDKRYYHAK
jgi:hypothetical protein